MGRYPLGGTMACWSCLEGVGWGRKRGVANSKVGMGVCVYVVSRACKCRIWRLEGWMSEKLGK